ncbi:unnamed protein product [Rhizophagus irregularis]|nr:unnamed protein product [Rhizophagus irregularis]
MKLRIYSQCRIARIGKTKNFKEKLLSKKRRYGNFSRNISLSPNIKAEEVTAKFENGVLEMRLSKSALLARKSISYKKDSTSSN